MHDFLRITKWDYRVPIRTRRLIYNFKRVVDRLIDEEGKGMNTVVWTLPKNLNRVCLSKRLLKSY